MKKSIFKTIADKIKDDIAIQGYQSGDRLPTEHELCAIYNCSRQTIRKAIAVLSEDGVLKSRQGSGIYLADHTLPRHIIGKQSIAVIVPRLSIFIYPEIIEEIENILSPLGYQIMLFQTGGIHRQEKAILTRLIASPPAGIIIIDMRDHTPLKYYYETLEKSGCSIIMADYKYVELPQLSSVTVDNYRVGYESAKILVESGCKKPLGVFITPCNPHLSRASGFLAGLMEGGVEYDEHNLLSVFETSSIFMNGYFLDDIDYKKTASLLGDIQKCDGIICGDINLPPLMNTIHEAGLRIPDDLSVISITDSELAKPYAPLSAMSHPKGEMGSTIANLMLELLNGAPNKDIILSFKYIDRGTVKER